MADSQRADQRTDYAKGHGNKMEAATGSMETYRGGSGSSGSNSGPTGSARDYPKGKNVRSTDFNPMKCCASTYAVDGV